MASEAQSYPTSLTTCKKLQSSGRRGCKPIGPRLVDGDAPDGRGPPRLGIHVDDRPVQAAIPGRHFKMRGPEGPRGFKNAFNASAYDTLVGTGHSYIALERGAVRKNPLVGGGHVGMGSENRRHPSIEVSPHDLLVAGGLGVVVEEDHAGTTRHRGEDAVGGLQRTIDRRHEDPALKTEHCHLDLAFGPQHGEGTTWGLTRVVGRPDDPLFALEEREDLAAPINVVAHGDAVDTAGEQFLKDLGRQPRPARRILGIGDYEIELLGNPKARDGTDGDLTTGFSDHVANE